MSVICQNFVQNAWKKDLCSNCFKSVGDHRKGDSAPNPLQEGSGEKSKVRYVSQSPATNARSNGETPHTTWKSLISEKNQRNSKPFKLETGFRGRLLTINKATNGTEKKNGGEDRQNGFQSSVPNGHRGENCRHSAESGNEGVVDNGSTDGETAITVEVSDTAGECHPSNLTVCDPSASDALRGEAKPTVNGFATKYATHCQWKTLSSEISRTAVDERVSKFKPSVSLYSKKKSTFNDLLPPEKMDHRLNGVRDTTGILCNGVTKEHEESAVVLNVFSGKEHNESKFGSEENTCSTVPQSILKRTFHSFDNNPPRRGSNVGFKDEQPQIIGYGGRDFSPEDLEWEMASSDGEMENNSDSLDDTEDDRAFSKMTRKNTEFNSDNSNLLQLCDKENDVIQAETLPTKNKAGDLELDAERELARRAEGAGDGPKKEDFEGGRDGEVTAAGVESTEREKTSREGLSTAMQVENRAAVGDEEPEGMFADCGESSEWADDFSLPAEEILQAINISLTTRHEMKDRLPGDEENKLSGNEVTNEEERSPDAHDEDIDSVVVEPRASFLHGVVSSDKASKPSAIYGPASDLFVTRSNSSSSSSSEEPSPSDTSVTVTVAAGDDGNAERGVNGKDAKDKQIVDKNSIKLKPKVPVKPIKQPKQYHVDEPSSSETTDGTYYCIPESPQSTCLVDHYAESGIYQEVKIQEVEPFSKDAKEERDTKLAALAVELEQARQLQSNTKRQAPAPPKIPDPPLEDPPSCAGFTSFRGEAMGFSSASSTTSTSSQETETAYASWTLGDETRPRYSKSKSSFLLAQYSKCKMLAMGYAEDGKRFSLKKLLKIGKEQQAAFNPNCPTHPKAWKYSDRFERPRAKLEIIHPMDLENKSVTVNPGFESSQPGSMTSFAPEDGSSRNSVFSDYGSYYSDTLPHDSKPEVTYESIRPQAEERGGGDDTGRSISPTPSRSSQASTLTSGSSKNGSSPPHRPPKPPPPPRAHSLLPGNKTPRNMDGTFKFPVVGCNSWNGEDSVFLPPKPQAPRRQCKAPTPRSDYANFEDYKSLSESDCISEREEKEVQETSDETASPEPHGGSSRNEDSKEPAVENLTLDGEETDEKSGKVVPAVGKPSPFTKAPARPPPIYCRPQPGVPAKKTDPWNCLEDSYLALTSNNRELLIKLLNQALRKRKCFSAELQKIQFRWSDFEVDAPVVCGERVVCDATMPRRPETPVTLVIASQLAENPMQETEVKYPVYGRFVDQVSEDVLTDAPFSSVLVLSQSDVTTVDSFSQSLPSTLTQECEKELCFVTLQLIHSLKSFQAQGVESMESHFQNLLLAKSPRDPYHTLVFVSDNLYDESDETRNVSLCQYALLLLSQVLRQEDGRKFSTQTAESVFRAAIDLLSEEKAGSLSRTKILLECFLWDATRVLENSRFLDDPDVVLSRWFDVERSNCIKSMVTAESDVMSLQREYQCQFLIRTNVRNVREVCSLLFVGRT